MKIDFFGDSIGKGIVYNGEKGRYLPTEKCFVNLLSADEGFDVVNYSRFGCTVTRGSLILNQHFDTVGDSDCVVLEFGGNDSDFNWREISNNPDAEHQPNTPISVFTETYRTMIDKVKSCGKRLVMLNLPPVDANRYFAWVSKGLNPDNIRKWLGGSESYIYRWHEMYNDLICNLANSMKVTMIDLRSAFLYRRDYSSFLCADGIHPNEAGHALITGSLRTAIAQMA